MENLLKIKLNCKKNYSYAAYHSGFDLFDSIYLENQTDLAFSALKIQVFSAPNILLSAERNIDYLGSCGYRFISCDFISTDISFLASNRKIQDVTITVIVKNEEGKLLASQDFATKILPYFYFSGTGDMPETAAFFVTPSQPELEMIRLDSIVSDPVDHMHLLYDKVKSLRITYAQEDFSGKVSLPVRLCERVLKEKFASSFEFALLFASALEFAKLSPVIAFAGRGRVFCGISLRKNNLPLLHLSLPGARDLDDFCLIDASDLAVGSSHSFGTAIYQAKNGIGLSDDKITFLSIESARKYHIMPLPVRVSENGNYVLTDRQEEAHQHNFSDYDKLWKEYSDDDRVKSILLGNKLSVKSDKTSFPFQTDLDVNQNKILSKVLSNDFTLIRALSGVGVSTLFSRATENFIREGKNVLYLTDSNFHPDSFENICSGLFDPSFVWNLLKDQNFTLSNDQNFGNDTVPEKEETAFEKMQECIRKLDDYYAALEGDKRIVSSFLMASDRYDQLQDENDSIIFSPEQVGQLSDAMVQEWFSTVNEMVRTLSEIGSAHENPLEVIRNQHFSYEYKSKLIQKLEDILRSIESIISYRDQILPLFPALDHLLTYSDLSSFCDLFRLFSDFETIPESFFENPGEIEENFRKVTRLIQAKEENDNILQIVNVSFFETVLDLDARELYTRYSALAADKGFKALSQKHGILKSVKKYLKPNCDVENIEYVLSRLYHYQKNRELLEQEKSQVFSLLSVSDCDEDCAWKKLQVNSDLCYQCYAVFQNSFELKRLKDFVSDFQKARSFHGVSNKFAALRDYLEDFSDLKKGLDRLIFNQVDFFYPHASLDVDYFSHLYENLTSVLSSADQLKNWCSWLSVKEKAISIGLKNVVSSLENGRISNEELKRGFLRAFFKAVCEYNFISHPELIPENFSVSTCVNEYEAARKDYAKERIVSLNSVLDKARRETLNSLGKMEVSPKAFLENVKRFSKIYPCVISDIRTAKNLFSDKKYCFDLILIESRKPVSLNDLIWTFFAGKQVAFAGSFSAVNHSLAASFDLSNPAFDYLWKITDEKFSLSASYYSSPLLTCFKNAYFSNLRSDFRYYTVPAPVNKKVTEWKVLPGTFGGEYPGANLYEAKYVVDELVSFAMSEKEKSIGVIASTPEQKKLILRLFAQKLRHQDELAELFSDYKRFYVSSVFDPIYPCDKVIFSATFAADRSMPGSRLDFSMLEFAGGDPIGAIVSMISCAKEEILVLSSFKKEELSYSPTMLSCNKAFQYLFDSLTVPNANFSYQLIGSSAEVSIIKRLRNELEERGYSVRSGLRSGRYYIDLAVQDENSNFVLGILSDHSIVNYQANVASIELSNLNYYEDCGWQIYRLHAASSFDSFEIELQNILSILQKNGPGLSLI